MVAMAVGIYDELKIQAVLLQKISYPFRIAARVIRQASFVGM